MLTLTENTLQIEREIAREKKERKYKKRNEYFLSSKIDKLLVIQRNKALMYNYTCLCECGQTIVVSHENLRAMLEGRNYGCCGNKKCMPYTAYVDYLLRRTNE